jgi:hypothetical protein
MDILADIFTTLTATIYLCTLSLATVALILGLRRLTRKK